jgi:hypothetical protein
VPGSASADLAKLRCRLLAFTPMAEAIKLLVARLNTFPDQAEMRLLPAQDSSHIIEADHVAMAPLEGSHEL